MDSNSNFTNGCDNTCEDTTAKEHVLSTFQSDNEHSDDHELPVSPSQYTNNHCLETPEHNQHPTQLNSFHAESDPSDLNSESTSGHGDQDDLQGEIQRLLRDGLEDVYLSQLESLEKVVASLQKDKANLEKELKTELTKHEHIEEDWCIKEKKLNFDLTSLRAERDSAVMKYAKNEREVLMQCKEKEVMDRKLREMAREGEGLTQRLKNISTEKARLTHALDTKSSEAYASRRDAERLKEELSSRDIKSKWLQNKLSSEVDKHQDTQKQLQSSRELISTLQTELEKVQSDYEQLVTEQENAKEKTIESEPSTLKELCELDSLRKKNSVLLQENYGLIAKVHNLEKDRLDCEQRMGRLQEDTSSAQMSIAQVQTQLAHRESECAQLSRVQERVTMLESEVKRLRTTNAELLSDMAACRQKEAELLDFTQKVTDKNVQLQIDISATEAKLQATAWDASSWEHSLTDVQSDLDNNQVLRRKEKESYELQLNELQSQLLECKNNNELLSRQLEESRTEANVIRKRMAQGLKEALREIQQLRRRQDQSSPSSNLSRSPSQGSLDNNISSWKKNESPSSPINEVAPSLLIARIGKLQRVLGRRNEKIEFLEEHSHHLVEALKKKTHLLQALTLQMAPAVPAMGMIPPPNSPPSEQAQFKLQNVLEDTLLKNITLKDSLNTLGEEISRLLRDNNEMKKRLNSITNHADIKK